MAHKYKIKHFYDITDRSDFRANPDYKGVCHVAMAQEGHCLPGAPLHAALGLGLGLALGRPQPHCAESASPKPQSGARLA